MTPTLKQWDSAKEALEEVLEILKEPFMTEAEQLMQKVDEQLVEAKKVMASACLVVANLQNLSYALLDKIEKEKANGSN